MKAKLKQLIEDYACRPKQVVPLPATEAAKIALYDYIDSVEIVAAEVKAAA
ncbi:hypothetical protein [Reyranella soli]|nr:hypothetical protein [Reyranella soli]